MAQNSRQAALRIKGHHQGGGKVSRGKTLWLWFQADSSPWDAAGVKAGPLEAMELGRATAHPPAQTPLKLAGVFKGCSVPGTLGCCFFQALPRDKMNHFYFNTISERQRRGGDGAGGGLVLFWHRGTRAHRHTNAGRQRL